MIIVFYLKENPNSDLRFNQRYFAEDEGDCYCIFENEEKYECGIFLGYYNKEYFITLAEMRDKKIEEILN